MTVLREYSPSVERISTNGEASQSMLARFLDGDDETTELMVRLAVQTDQPLAGVYEQLRMGVSRAATSPDLQPLIETELDESLVRLAARLRSPASARPTWQATVVSIAGRGVPACIAHLMADAGIPTAVVPAAPGERGSTPGAAALSHLLPSIEFVIIDGSRAQQEAILRVLRLVKSVSGPMITRSSMILLTDPGRPNDPAYAEIIPDLTVVGQLGALLGALGISAGNPLTAREREVLSHVATGATNEQIARRLGVAVSTIKTYLERIHVKLRSRDRASAVAIALQREWL
ncbi:MAG TPA: helix-turn-helix transcriptional regulator [Mycobacteriales bacterium]|nr:helix-turn-helix transcriptional regulator [Mycobacteriales bacterium]